MAKVKDILAEVAVIEKDHLENADPAYRNNPQPTRLIALVRQLADALNPQTPKVAPKKDKKK